MTRSELIALIESVIEELDNLGAGMPAGDARTELDQLRDQLSDQQLRLIEANFNENTAAFQNATAQLAAINRDLKVTISEIDKVVETIANLTRFIAAVDQVLTAIGAVV